MVLNHHFFLLAEFLFLLCYTAVPYYALCNITTFHFTLYFILDDNVQYSVLVFYYCCQGVYVSGPVCWFVCLTAGLWKAAVCTAPHSDAGRCHIAGYFVK